MKTKRKTTVIISVVIAAVLVVSLSFLFVGSSFAYDKIADDINENHDSMSDEEFIEYSTKLSAVVEKSLLTNSRRLLWSNKIQNHSEPHCWTCAKGKK